MVIFWGLKFDIFSIPNFLGTFYVLGSPAENDLNPRKPGGFKEIELVNSVVESHDEVER